MDLICRIKRWLAQRARRRHVNLVHQRLIDLQLKLAEAKELGASYRAQVEVWTGFTSGHHTSHDRDRLATAKSHLYQYEARVQYLTAALASHTAAMYRDGLLSPQFKPGGMSKERWRSLVSSDGNLTPEELKQGWHFCPEWDGLLIHPDMPESRACTCCRKTP